MTNWHNRSHCNRTHVDEGVLRYFYETLGCRSLLDIGCGPGGQVLAAKKVGYVAAGVDGDAECAPLWLHDFLREPFILDAPYRYDLAWCCEFLEHIPEDKLDNVWPCFDACKYAAITAHPPTGVKNEFHYNEQGEDYWINKFEKRGWKFYPSQNFPARAASTMKRNFFRDNGLVFFNPKWSGA